MQGTLYFSMHDKHHKEITLINNFCQNKQNNNLLVCVNSIEESDFIEEFFHRQDAMIISDIEIKENVILNDTDDYIYSTIDNCDSDIIILKNPDNLLGLDQKSAYAIFLKQFIDEAQEADYKIVIIAQNEQRFSILTDLFSRVRSFNRIFLNA